ncbi:MAG: hypothetical protein PHO30_04170 [Candidatus Omnitrophica bacterium]|nr:hypothetical protein [Candidatus Omnitrophota bacterium]
MLNPMCRRIFQSVSLWLLMPALILPAGPAWAVPERNYAAETLAAPLTLSLPDFQSVYRRYSAERFGENHNTSDAREILLAAVEVILEKGITAFSANTFYDDLGKALGLSRTMNKPARTKLRDAV